jgi:hypothetical protein
MHKKAIIMGLWFSIQSAYGLTAPANGDLKKVLKLYDFKKDLKQKIQSCLGWKSELCLRLFDAIANKCSDKK